MRVLIVDDSRVMRMMVRRALRQTGIGKLDVVEAENGQEGLAQMEAQMPDLVLSDWNMPVMGGLDFLIEVRARGWTTPFGLVTSEGSAELRGQAANNGANFLIQKPFSAADFEIVVGTLA